MRKLLLFLSLSMGLAQTPPGSITTTTIPRPDGTKTTIITAIAGSLIDTNRVTCTGILTKDSMGRNGIDIGCNIGNEQESHESHILAPILTTNPTIGSSAVFSYQLGINSVQFTISQGNPATPEGWMANANGVVKSGSFT